MKYADLTAEWLKKTYFFGIDLRDTDGNEMPDEIFEFGIRSSKDYIENKTNLYLELKTIEKEIHDYRAVEYRNWGFIQAQFRPVNKVNALIFKYGAGEFTFPLEWIRVKPSSGIINMIPTIATFGSQFIDGGGQYMPILFSRYSNIPQIFELNYDAGFDDIPELILNTLGMQATINAFDILGDLVGGGPGIASYSISIDGLSQSLGSTSSATNAGYGSRIIQYQKEIKENLKIIRAKYTGIQISVG